MCELTVVLGVAQAQSQVVHVLQDLFQGQLSQFTAGTTETEDRDAAGYSTSFYFIQETVPMWTEPLPVSPLSPGPKNNK